MKTTRYTRAVKVSCALLGIGIASQSYSNTPTWWDDQETMIWETEPSEEDHFSPVNLGQLKHVASQARKHLDLAVADALPNLPPEVTGSGDDLGTLIDGFTQDDNFAPARVDQLRSVAKVFYDRLHEIGYDSRTSLVLNGVSEATVDGWYPDGAPFYPGDPAAPAVEDGAPANIGQLKFVFAFDLERVDAQGEPLLWDPSADSDGDGFSNGQEIAEGTHAGDATDHGVGGGDDSDGDGLLDSEEPQVGSIVGIKDHPDVQLTVGIF